MTLADIDFGRLYRDHLAAASRSPKPATAWDTRAAEMGRRFIDSPYAEQFVARMNLDGSRTLLDVGCGPGTIGLKLAPQLQQMIGLDYSRGMLDALMTHAQARGLHNVQALHRAWEDDWSDVPECDIVVASRSTTVEDMDQALAKLHAKARQRVYLTHLVGGRFIDPVVLDVLKRPLPAMPDYVYIVNILHRMGIHPRLDYIEHPSRLAGTTHFEEFAARVAWTLGDLQPDEQARLRAWYDGPSQGGTRVAPTRWAFISWDKTPGPTGLESPCPPCGSPHHA